MFDQAWEKLIYKKNKQINKYPYDWVVSSTNKYILKKPNLIALDLGSGIGNNVSFLYDYGFKKIHAIEGSKTAVNLLKKKFKNNKKIKIIYKDFNLYNFKYYNYDLILDRGSITHNKIENIKSILNNINHSLKKNGYLFSVLFNKKGEFKKIKKNSYTFKNVTQNNRGLLANFFSKKEILQLFKNFYIVDLTEVTSISYLPKKKVFSTWNIICKKKR